MSWGEMSKDVTQTVRFLVLGGEGIGPEISCAAASVLQAVAKGLEITLHLDMAVIGLPALHACGTTIPASVVEQARRADGVILGPISHNTYPPIGEGGLNPSGVLRSQLDLYANVRPARQLGNIPPRGGKPFDLVIVRENTEGFYADRSMFAGPGELMPTPDIALSLRKVSREGSTRISKAAFSIAAGRRRRVTAVHKANVLRLSDGLFLECVRAVAACHADIAYEEELVDAMAAHLVRDPGRFDVVVTTNMFGDILSDEASELSGSLGLAPSLNVGADHAVAQAQHGSAVDIAGKDVANPTSLIGSTAMLLSWLGDRRSDEVLTHAGKLMDAALDLTLSDPMKRTRDLGGPLGTKAFTAEVIRNARSLLAQRGSSRT